MSLPSPQVPTIDEYVQAFCEAPLTRGAVNGLSSLLARAVGAELQVRLPKQKVEVGHRSFGGSNRRHHLDIYIADGQLGLKLGIDVKGLNHPKSVGKNYNNRVGDLVELALNHHQHFPSAVMGGVLAVPLEGLSEYVLQTLERSMFKLQGRRAIANSHSLHEVAALIVIDKHSRKIVDHVPEPKSPLRFETFSDTIARVYMDRWS